MGGKTDNIIQPNGKMMVIPTIIRNAMYSAAGEEYGALFYNVK